MTDNSGNWQVLGEELPIISAAQPIQAALLPSRRGELRLESVKGGFPSGELVVILSNWPETRHWYAPARMVEGVVCCDMRGAQVSWDREDARPCLLSLALRKENGLVQYPLRASHMMARLRPGARNAYVYDERELWGEPVDTFFEGGSFWETLPRYIRLDKKVVTFGLEFWPRSFRYWHQTGFQLTGLDIEDGMIRISARPPEGGMEIEGFAFHREPREAEHSLCFPAEGEGEEKSALIPLSKLPEDGEQYILSAVTDRRDGMEFYVPLAISDPRLHQKAEELANATLLLDRPRGGIYLTLNVLGRPSFLQTGRPFSAQREIQADSLRQAIESGALVQQGQWAIRDLGGEEWLWHFEVPGICCRAGDELLMTARNKNGCWFLPVEQISAAPGANAFSVDLSQLAAQLQNSLTTRWDLDFALRQGKNWYYVRLRDPYRITRRLKGKSRLYMDDRFAFGEVIGQTVVGLIGATSNGFCQLQTSDKLRRYERQLVCRTENARIRGTRLNIRVSCPNFVPGKWTGFALVRRYKLEVDREIFFFPAQAREEGEVTLLSAEVDLSQFTFSPLYWDIRAVFTVGEDPYLVPTRMPDRQDSSLVAKLRRWSKRLERTLFPGSYRQGEDLSVSLYTTADRNYALVCQEYSPYSGFAFRMKERLALLLARLFKKQLAEKSIFLVYEKYCCMAQDNGFYFFRHCMENDMEREMNRSIYFVIDKKQPDYQERLLPYADHVIDFMSLKHMVYILAAKLLISSDSKAHAYAWRAKESIILPRVQHGKKLVFLQHGVIALKRVEFYSKGTNAVSLFVTSNQREHDIIVNEMAYPPEDVIITGLARWDVLRDRPIEEKHILVMPTWRNWLEEVSDEVFMASDYYRNYMDLLNDDRLARLLEEKDLYLDFYIHPKFREYLSNFSLSGGERVRLIPFGSEPLNELMMECRMLITDYSSVCWDVYYQGKPVLFYQFDVDKYNETTGSYIDLETELFGDRVMTAEELLSQLEAYADRDFALPEVYAKMRPDMYEYLDHNNSQRICEEIMKRNW